MFLIIVYSINTNILLVVFLHSKHTYFLESTFWSCTSVIGHNSDRDVTEQGSFQIPAFSVLKTIYVSVKLILIQKMVINRIVYGSDWAYIKKINYN